MGKTSNTSLNEIGRSINGIAAIRDEACRRAETMLGDLAVQAGFRRARGTRTQFHCICGPDKSPSARLYEDHAHCFRCGGHWSPIDLVMLRDNCKYVPAVRTLAAETFTPMPDISPQEREKQRIARQLAPELARHMGDWAHGLSLWAESRKTDLIAAIEFALESGSIELVQHFDEQLIALRPALTIRTMNPNALARAYADLVQSNAGAVLRFTAIGRGDREHAELATAGVIQILAAVQLMETPAKGGVN